MLKELKDTIVEGIMPILADAGLELFDIQIKNERGGPVIELFVDKATGGIGMDECAAFHKKVVEKFDEEIFGEDNNYELAVSSPGMDWPLKSKKDFVRILGRKIRIFLTEPVYEKKELVGIVSNVEDDRVLINCLNKSKGKEKILEELKVPFNKIIKGIQII